LVKERITIEFCVILRFEYVDSMGWDEGMCGEVRGERNSLEDGRTILKQIKEI
jgi:hypothetical protein